MDSEKHDVCGVWGGCGPCDRAAKRRLCSIALSDKPSFPVTDLERVWFKDPPMLTREVIVKPLRGHEQLSGWDRLMYGLIAAVVLMGLISIPLAVITHELAAHGWIDRVGP
jgi:hypothetical protein